MNQVSEEVAIEQTARLRNSPHPPLPLKGGG
jgi:hypothetical protein